MELFTAGVDGHEPDRLAAALAERGVTAVVDIRAGVAADCPYRVAFKAAGMVTVDLSGHFAGTETVGILSASLVDSSGPVYERYVAEPFFQAGVMRLATAQARGFTLAVVGRDADPQRCARGRLVVPFLADPAAAELLGGAVFSPVELAAPADDDGTVVETTVDGDDSQLDLFAS